MANILAKKRIRRIRRKHHVRSGINGTTERPRLSVFKSAKHIYAQIIDDSTGRTLASASTMGKDLRPQLKYGGNKTAAKLVGESLATKAIAAGVKQVVFDRNGYRYHGRLQALADAAREKGLTF